MYSSLPFISKDDMSLKTPIDPYIGLAPYGTTQNKNKSGLAGLFGPGLTVRRNDDLNA